MGFFTALSAATSIASLRSGRDSQRTANSLASGQLQLQREALDFSKQQYNDWLEVFGPIQDNLSSFYTNLTPEYIESQGLQAQQQVYQQQMAQLDEFFTVNEIDPNIQADIRADTAMEHTRRQAEIRADAPFKVAEAQQGFLSLGVNQGPQYAGQVTNAITNLSTTMGRQASIAGETARGYYNSAAEGLGVVAQALDRRFGFGNRQTANQGDSEIV